MPIEFFTKGKVCEGWEVTDRRVEISAKSEVGECWREVVSDIIVDELVSKSKMSGLGRKIE